MNAFLKTTIRLADNLVTPDELKIAAALQEKFDLLQSHKARYALGRRGDEIVAAQQAYIANPTNEALDLLEMAQRDFVTFGGSTTQRNVAEQVKHAETKFFREEVFPWLEPIWARLKCLCEKRVNKVKAEEAKRVLELTGEELTQSDVVEAALGALKNIGEQGKACGFLIDKEARDDDRRAPVEWLKYFGYDLNGRSAEK